MTTALVPTMTVDKAREIYNHPKGHTKEELRQCIRVLNEAAQPVELYPIQVAALTDAALRLNLLPEGETNGKTKTR